jgi:DNA repair protein RadC
MDRHASRPEAALSYAIASSAERVRDLPERLRPREEMERVGAEHVSDDVLLAVLLRSGTRGHNVLELARGLLKRYGSLTALSRLSVNELAGVKGVGPVKAQVVKAALELARRLTQESTADRMRIRTPGDVTRLLRDTVRTLDREVFWVVMLDARNRLKGRPLDVSRGLLDSSLVHPREIFREAVRGGAAAVVLAHNHPSGDPSPSAEDLRITKQLVEAGRIMDIKVLDHTILAIPARDGKEYLSLREEGIVEF